MGTLTRPSARCHIGTSPSKACRSILRVVGITTFLLLTQLPAWAHRNEHPGILLLYDRQKEGPYAQFIRAGLVEELNGRVASPVSVFTDTVAGWNEAEDSGDRSLLRVLQQRYSRTNIHLLVPVGNSAVAFARLHGRELFPEASIVYMAQSFGSRPINPPILDGAGVIVRFEPEATLQVALQQNPGTNQVVVVAGTSASEKAELFAARNAFRKYEASFAFRYLTDVTFAEVLRHVAKLPQDAVVILLNFEQDSSGDEFIPGQILPSISRAVNRPIYVVYGPSVGAGVLGGRVHDFSLVGQALGRLAVEVLRGTKPSDLPVEEGTFQKTVFDWQQMQRWGIAERQLPADSVIINREPPAWRKYRWWILGALALLGAQAGLIFFLIVARVRRRRAERELANEVELEELVSELAMAFVNIPSGQVREQIERSCNRLLRFFRVDRIALFEFSPAKDLLTLLYGYRTAGIEGFPAELKPEELPWMRDRVLTGKPILISSLDDVPTSAAADRAYIQERGVRSIAIVPLTIEQDVSGILVLTAVQQEVQWSARIAERLQTVSHIFANALDKKRSEEALHASENLKARILDSLSSHLAVIGRTGSIVAVNKGWKDYGIENGGFGEEQIGVGANYLDVCRKAAEAGCSEAERARNGILSVLEGKIEHFEMEYDCSSPDQNRWFTMAVTPLRHGAGGAVIRHLDITFRNQALGMLRESEERFRLVADSAPVMIWMAGPDRLCNYCNKVWLDFRGRSLDAESGEGWKEGIHSEDKDRCMRIYDESFNSRRPFIMEYRLRRADGEYRWILEKGVPRTLEDGTFAGFIGACVDITEQRDSDRARAQLSGLLITAQEQERASIARELHDHVNQRLALLAIEIQQFETTAERLSGKERDELERLWDLVNDVSHDVQTLSHQLHSSQLQHLGLVVGLRTLCQEFSKGNTVQAECRCEGSIPRIDENVALALFRVAQEALRNVAKYSRAQTVEASLHCDHDVLTLRVNDDGIGFDSARTDGKGLGLISMRERMRLVGGELIVRSSPGQGTRIEARISLVHGTAKKFPPDTPARVERRRRMRA